MIWIIARRELSTRGRSKGFLITTAILFVAVVAVALLLTLIGGSGEPRTVTIGVEGDATSLVDQLAVGNEDLDPTVEVIENGRALLEEGQIDVLFDGTTLTWASRPDNTLDTYVRDVVQQATFNARAAELGVSGDDVQYLFEGVDIAEVRLDGGDEDFGVRLAAASVTGFATFMLLQTWGSFMLMGVIEEKSSKVVEVLLSHVRPSTLLAGKVLGLGILAVVQMLIFVLGIVVGLVLVRDVTVPGQVWGTIPLFVVTFLLGFAFYSTAFAAVGSMVSRQEDAQASQLPVMLPLLVGYFVGASSISSPGNLGVTVGSFVPFTSPVLLPFRMAMVSVPWWQVALSLAILAASIVVMLRAAGRIYRYSLLKTGSRVTWSEAWRNRSDGSL